MKKLLYALLVMSFFGASMSQACIWKITNDTENPVIVVVNREKAIYFGPRQFQSVNATIDEKWWKPVEKYIFREVLSIYLESEQKNVFDKRHKLTERVCPDKSGSFTISEVNRTTKNVTDRFRIRTYEPRVIRKQTEQKVVVQTSKSREEEKNGKKKKNKRRKDRKS